MAMRGVETRIQEIRHRIFTEVARMAYHTEWPTDRRIEALPFDIMPGEVGNIRNDIFLERAIVGERLRLAMGLPCRSAAEHAPLSDNIEAATREETYYTPPLINVIKFACHAAAWMFVSITPSSVRSARARQPAAWMPSTATAMAEPILITRSAFPAASAL